MSYQLNKAHIIVCIFASTVLTGGFVYILFFDEPFPLVTMTTWISGCIVFFYFVGHFVRSYLIENVFVPPPIVDFSEDEEYLAFAASLENDAGEPADVMKEDPLQLDEFDDPLEDSYLETMPLEGA